MVPNVLIVSILRFPRMGLIKPGISKPFLTLYRERTAFDGYKSGQK